MIATGFSKEEVSIDRLRCHIDTLAGERHPLTSPEALERAADYITETLTALDYDVTEHRFTANSRQYRNVVASRRGSHLPHERVVALAHYDTVVGSPGADDNASGVAVLLELATLMAQFRFKRTLHFIAVNLEENERSNDPDSGTRGSRALAAYARENRWSIEGVIVLESVAYAGDDVRQTAPSGVPVVVPEKGDFIALVGNERSRELVDGFARVIERQRLPVPHVNLVVPGNGEQVPDSRRSDHAAFWDEGYRAIMVTDTTNFRNPHYHQSSDTPETLNMEFAAKVCSAAVEFLTELAEPTV